MWAQKTTELILKQYLRGTLYKPWLLRSNVLGRGHKRATNKNDKKIGDGLQATGGGWKATGSRLMHAQRVVSQWRLFVSCQRIGVCAELVCITTEVQECDICKGKFNLYIAYILHGLIPNHICSVSLYQRISSFERICHFVRNRKRARTVSACCGIHSPEAVSIVV